MVWLRCRQPLPPQRCGRTCWAGTARPICWKQCGTLQRRSLLEKAGTGFGLQNLVIGFLTDWLVEAGLPEIVAGPIDCLDRFALLHTGQRVHPWQPNPAHS